MKTQIKVLTSNDPTLPPLVLHIIHLVDSYMLWIGVSSSGDGNDAQRVILNGNLCRDWACAMPPSINVGGCVKNTCSAN
jgi:proteasome assembly chaperone 4